MKKLFFATSISVALLFAACNSGNRNDMDTRNDSLATTLPTSTPSDNLQTGSMDTTSAASLTKDDRDFAEEASKGGLLEVTLGNLAKERATTSSIKEFGQKMVNDHTKANNELMAILKRKNMPVDVSYDKDQQKLIDKLSNLGGKDFEKEYVDAMVKDHNDDVDDFKKAIDNVSDQELKSWAQNTLPILEQHRAEIKRIQDNLKK